MRDIPEELAARLASGTTTLAYVWRVTRRDGAVFGFTDHDRPLAFDDLTCAPTQALRIGAIEKSLGLGVDNASATGSLNADAITEEDLSRGLWDGARVDVFKVDWTDTILCVHLFAGRIGEVKRGAQAFEAELRGSQAPLNVPVGRVFSRFCDADLGDGRCGLDLTDPAFSATGAVAAVLNASAFTTSDLGAFADGWLTRGRVVWDGGGQSEIGAHRLEGAIATIELLDAPGAALNSGAAFTVFAGCDKQLTTCQNKFANVGNFRGFPHMPGNDAVQAGPQAGAVLDGSSRFS